MLKIYFCRLTEKELPFSTERLSAYRREKLAKQTNARVRMQSAASELLLLYALEDSGHPAQGPLDIGTGGHGKPFLKNGACRFSLSHSADALLCALCDREIGADVQKKSRAQRAVIERCLTADEQACVRGASDPDAAFTAIWTKKESRCKLDGRGLALPLGSFSVFDEAIAPLLWHAAAGEYHVAVCSDAVRTERPEWIEVKTDALFR
jgi:4'-phosphopantetheinyl transferase